LNCSVIYLSYIFKLLIKIAVPLRLLNVSIYVGPTDQLYKVVLRALTKYHHTSDATSLLSIMGVDELRASAPKKHEKNKGDTIGWVHLLSVLKLLQSCLPTNTIWKIAKPLPKFKIVVVMAFTKFKKIYYLSIFEKI